MTQEFAMDSGLSLGLTRRNPPKRAGLTDYDLVQRAARGDNIAFSELVHRHYERALRVAVGLLKNRHDAEDAVQDAFAKVHRRLGDFEGNSSFYTWLYRIVVNRCLDGMRSTKRRRLVDAEEERAARALEKSNSPWQNFDTSCPQGHVERQDIAQRLRQALGDIPDIYQAVLILREVEGQSYEEIAHTLGIKKGTVMSRLFKARKLIQERLRQDDPETHNHPMTEVG